ncbi:hypothetical protein RchiOBHm_Chr7g0194971 [Rosa chinensis]|uniref:Uncharacterized protein n=1 Tax=Rosa chinensis TaxID=74649 RepID=A0A2P6P697_ROSCH|nr:hypothetical protein RchiOBHm_Chr7g0194971 [Rosa chinensis]
MFSPSLLTLIYSIFSNFTLLSLPYINTFSSHSKRHSFIHSIFFVSPFPFHFPIPIPSSISSSLSLHFLSIFLLHSLVAKFCIFKQGEEEEEGAVKIISSIIHLEGLLPRFKIQPSSSPSPSPLTVILIPPYLCLLVYIYSLFHFCK